MDSNDKLQQDILLTDYFRPDRLKMQFGVGAFLTKLVAAREELEVCLQDLRRLGWLNDVESWDKKSPGGYFEVAPEGFRAAEDLRRRLGRRHPALVAQRCHSLDDLLLALGSEKSIHAGYALRPSTLGNGLTVHNLYFYLDDYDQASIDAGIKGLVAAHLAYTANRGDREKLYFSPSERGFNKYMTEVRFRLGLGPTETILDEMTSGTTNIFLAFQTEYSKSRRIIEEALDDAVTYINGLPGLVRKLKIVIATEAGEGGIRIDLALLDKIKASPFFVGDVTPVEMSADKKRFRVNDCVLVELGYALAFKAVEDIVLPAMIRTKEDGFPDKKDTANPRFPFDIDHMHRVHFADKAQLKSQLRTELIAKLKRKHLLP